MDVISLLRTFGALGLVLGLLGGALWIVRRYDLNLPGRIGGAQRRRIEVVERLSLDPKRSIALIRRDGCEHLILIGPEGHVMIETDIKPSDTISTRSEHGGGSTAGPGSLASSFGALVERTQGWPRDRAKAEPVAFRSQRRLTGVAKRAARRVAAGA